MAVTIYVLFENGNRDAYIWHEPNRHDPAARIHAMKILEPGSTGYLFRGPTGVDKMEPLGKVQGRTRKEEPK